MADPAIKGSAFETAAADLLRLLEKGALRREEAVVALQPGDFALLENKPSASAWVPIDAYARIVDLLLRFEGRGDNEYLRQRGARAAERLFDSGLYAQLRHGAALGIASEEAGKDQFTERDGRLMTSLSGAIFNFGRWSFRVLEQGYEVEAAESEALPEVARYACEGFLEVMTSRTSRRDVRVTSKRVTLDRIVFWIPLPQKQK
jgi:hypothetical protein